MVANTKAWHKKLVSNTKKEVIAELGLPSGKDIASSRSGVDEKLKDLEDCLTGKDSTWLADFHEEIMMQVSEMLQQHSPSVPGVPYASWSHSQSGTPALPRQKHHSSSTSRSQATPGYYQSPFCHDWVTTWQIATSGRNGPHGTNSAGKRSPGH